MKKNRIINTLIVLLMAITATMTTSCTEEDAPEFAHSLGDLEGTWTWETTDGDEFTDFEVTISTISDTKIEIGNFGNQDESMPVTVSGTTLSFAKELSTMNITGGTGSITNGYATMEISFQYDTGDGPQTCRATLQNTRMVSKKQRVSAR